MATRIFARPNHLVASTVQIAQTVLSWSPQAAFAALLTHTWPNNLTIRERLVRLLWTPFWISSDLPAPPMSRSVFEHRIEMITGKRLLGILRSIRRRQLIFRFVSLFARSCVLTVILGCAWAIVALAGGPKINADLFVAIGLGLVLLSIVFGWAFRPGIRETARMLDISFDLSDRVTTAVDHLNAIAPVERSALHLTDLQLVDAINSVAMIRQHPALRVRLPVRELVAMIGFALLLLAIYLMRGTGDNLPLGGTSSVPAFVSAKDRMLQQANPQAVPERDPSDVPTVAEVQARADLSSSAEADLLEIADALDDNPLTSSIADAIRAGDYDRAASELSTVASDVSQLSPELRDQLATELDSAADAMTGKHPGLQDATEDAADGLRADQTKAEEELNDLSEQIAETGSVVESQEDLSSDMHDARESEESGDSSNDSRPEPGDQGAESQSEQQEIAGDGGDAASGQNNDTGDSDSQNTGGSGSDGQEQGSDSGSSASENGEPGQDGSSSKGEGGGESQTDEGQTSDGQGGTRGQQSGAQGQGEPDTESPTGGRSDEAQEGAGSGGESSEEIPANRQTSNGTEQNPSARDDDSPIPEMDDGDGTGSATSGDELIDTGQSITLSRAPDDSGYQSGGASSSSSGSGSGAAAGPGTVDQGDVGEAGPDSNSVPEEYRPIVEDYFSEEP